MLLSDRSIHRNSHMITPFDPKNVQPASYELHLSGQDGLRLGSQPHLMYGGELLYHPAPFGQRGEKTLWYDDLYLFATEETIRLPSNIAARVEGKSTLGRQGISIHVTAGFIDPGFHGQITLEVTVVKPTVVKAGMKIGQICFFELDAPAAKPYGSAELGSHYQGQQGPTPPAVLS